MACSSGCRTQDHASYGACLRSKNMQLNGLQSLGGDRDGQKKLDRSLALYGEARSAGLQPVSTKLGDSRNALDSNG